MNTKWIEKPQTHNRDLARLPSALNPLTDETRWVDWCWEPRENKYGELDWRKLPLRPRDLTPARSNDRSTWGTFERAVVRWRNGEADGIGFMLLGSNIGAADLDHCCQRDAESKKTKIDQWARDLRPEADGAYCEVTVSGTGLRLIGTATGGEMNRKFKIDNAHPKAKLELFRNSAQFITISGLQLRKCQQLPPFDEFIDTVLARQERSAEAAGLRGQSVVRDYDDLIRNGAPHGERSEAFHSVVWHLASKGLNVDQIVEELARYDGIRMKYADRLKQEVVRSYDKWRARNSGSE